MSRPFRATEFAEEIISICFKKMKIGSPPSTLWLTPLKKGPKCFIGVCFPLLPERFFLCTAPKLILLAVIVGYIRRIHVWRKSKCEIRIPTTNWRDSKLRLQRRLTPPPPPPPPYSSVQRPKRSAKLVLKREFHTDDEALMVLELVVVRAKEGIVLFNDALNTFYLCLYGVRHNYGKGPFR